MPNLYHGQERHCGDYRKATGLKPCTAIFIWTAVDGMETAEAVLQELDIHL
ncbi:MAG: hypothetical protein ACLRXA_23945 [Clostridium sp.]